MTDHQCLIFKKTRSSSSFEPTGAVIERAIRSIEPHNTRASLLYEGVHFERLVEHVGKYPTRRRKSLARIYGAKGERPEEIARTWCEEPERVREAARQRLGSDKAMRALRDLAFDHDITIPIDWVDGATKKSLDALGLIEPLGAGGLSHIENSMPAGLAAILSPMFDGVRTTLPLLLGATEVETVKRIAANHGLDPEIHHIPLALALSEMLSEIEVIEDFAESFTDVEVVGPAMMALELGGLCYWQEIFGYDLDGAGDDRKVVAFMKPDERHTERDIAETLLDHGICFRVDSGTEYSMLVVPEELWVPLWELGRRWLLEWTYSTWQMADEQGARRSVPSGFDAHAALKLLVCSADARDLPSAPGDLDLPQLEKFEALGWGGEGDWARAHRLGWELGVWTDDDGRAEFNQAAATLLDQPRATFVRSVLLEWVTGYVGAWADADLANAIGLDELWRAEVVKRLMARGEFAPAWMHFSGLPSEQTGAGCLRTVSAEDPDDLLLFEMGLANGLVWTEKLMWLDLLSLLADDCWYPLGQLVGLMQMSASVSVFGQLLHVLENPNAGYYVPVQRASFLIDPHHEDALRDWLENVIREILEPLGVARMNDDLVWLDTATLRIPTPPGLTDEGREQFMRDIFADASLEFRVPTMAPPPLRPVPQPTADDGIPVSSPLGVIRTAAAGREIKSFDGRTITLVED